MNTLLVDVEFTYFNREHHMLMKMSARVCVRIGQAVSSTSIGVAGDVLEQHVQEQLCDAWRGTALRNVRVEAQSHGASSTVSDDDPHITLQVYDEAKGPTNTDFDTLEVLEVIDGIGPTKFLGNIAMCTVRVADDAFRSAVALAMPPDSVVQGDS